MKFKFLKDKKGILGLDTVKEVIIGLLILAVIFIASTLALTSLQSSNIFTSGSQSYNQTTNVINNVTQGGTQFFSQVPTFFVLLGVVVLILIIAIVIVAVSRFQSGRGESL
jgi:NADH:ubiquinone oxidoreductase subunit 6 (subunit J)